MTDEITTRLSHRRPWRSAVDPSAVRDARAAVAHLKPAIVITGGSRGIGLALAKRFLDAGRTTAIVARNAPRLAEAARELETATGTAPETILCDVTEPTAAEIMRAALERSGLYLDILINNAGMGIAGPFSEQSPDDIARLLALNVESVTRLTRSALPGMIARQRGGVLNVASLGAYVPGPHQAVYYASKSYVLSFTEAIASEAAGSGVRISTLVPGPVDTGFHRDMGAESSFYRLVLPAMTPDRVASSAYWRFMLGQRVIVPGLLNPLFALALKVLPHILTVPMMRILLRRDPPPR